jgi:hypothetical protein
LTFVVLEGDGGLVGSSIPGRFGLCGLFRASGVATASGSGCSTEAEIGLAMSLEADVSKVASDYSVASEDEGA